LPDGAMIAAGGSAYAERHGKILPWTFAGYGPPTSPDHFGDETLVLLTPETTLAVLRHGFQTEWHPSAKA
ncbi:hypothetical protein EN801_041785, partial [Mesorhizobium sp. M00.F.Ca.ET.158.01.1.1]